MILTRLFSAAASAFGSAMAVGTFMLLTTPGVWSIHCGFPALGDISAFLIKDITLLGEALQRVRLKGAVLSRSLQR